jgi:hypothetical protein
MAISVENANLVRQKVKIALADAHPAIQAAFEDLQKYLATQGKNPDLQFLPFAAADVDTGADGKVLADAACKLYGVYAKRVSDVDTTAAFLNVADDATDNSVAADAVVVLRTNVASQIGCAIFPAGIAMAAGVVVSATTAPAGTTESAATESSNGFVIIGAA